MCDSGVMFLRRCHRKKNGKQHVYWALVESIRTAAGSRQRIVAYLGELADGEQSGWAQLGKHLQKHPRPQPSLFDPPHYEEPDEGEKILVKLKDIHLERLRDFGEVWLAYGLWRLLGLDAVLVEGIPPGRETISGVNSNRFKNGPELMQVSSTIFAGPAYRTG